MFNNCVYFCSIINMKSFSSMQFLFYTLSQCFSKWVPNAKPLTFEAPKVLIKHRNSWAYLNLLSFIIWEFIVKEKILVRNKQNLHKQKRENNLSKHRILCSLPNKHSIRLTKYRAPWLLWNLSAPCRRESFPLHINALW